MPGIGPLLLNRGRGDLAGGGDARGANATLGGGGPRHQLDDVFAAGLVGHRLVLAVGGQDDARAGAALHRVDALHRRGEIGNIERALQRGRQGDVADVDHHAGTIGAHVRRRAFAIEAEHQLARAAIAAAEVDVVDGDRARQLLGRVTGLRTHLAHGHQGHDAWRRRRLYARYRCQQTRGQSQGGRSDRQDATRRTRVLRVAHHQTSPNP